MPAPAGKLPGAGRETEVFPVIAIRPALLGRRPLAYERALNRRPPNLVRVILVDERLVETAPVCVVMHPDCSSDVLGEHRREEAGGERIADHKDRRSGLARVDHISRHKEILREDFTPANLGQGERLSRLGHFVLLVEEAGKVAPLAFLRGPERFRRIDAQIRMRIGFHHRVEPGDALRTVQWES